MDKQSLNKLKLMLQGLAVRLAEEADYFIGLEGDFKSGTKAFPLKGEPHAEGITLTFEGRSETLAPEALPDALAGHAARYEKVSLAYHARGESLLIEADAKNVTMRTKRLEEDREQAVKGHSETASVSGREYLIKVGKADDLLREIGIMAQNGKIKNDMIRKYNQIDHFVELLDPMLRDLAKGRSELRIVDCACGKSYLSFVLNYYIKEILKLNARFTGIDISEGVIASSRTMARNLGYRNMQFVQGDIRSLLYEEEGTGAIQPDLVISLHACDVATDYALAYGIRNRARGIVCVPCCHSELLSQYSYEPFKEITKHGVLKARLADVLTDGFRCMVLEAFGYNVSAVEYVSPLDTPKNLLIRATSSGSFNKAKYEACREMAQKLDAVPSLLKQTVNLHK